MRQQGNHRRFIPVFPKYYITFPEGMEEVRRLPSNTTENHKCSFSTLANRRKVAGGTS